MRREVNREDQYESPTKRERFVRNVWLAITIVAACFSISVLIKNGWHAIKISRQISRLEAEQEIYRERIEADSTLLEQLRYDEYLEQFARERYRMQRRNEHVYIMAE